MKNRRRTHLYAAMGNVAFFKLTKERINGFANRHDLITLLAGNASLQFTPVFANPNIYF